MSDFAFTRCPGCRTVFRVTTAQLALREGQVRCGRCRAVFDANDHFVQGAQGADVAVETPLRGEPGGSALVGGGAQEPQALAIEESPPGASGHEAEPAQELGRDEKPALPPAKEDGPVRERHGVEDESASVPQAIDEVCAALAEPATDLTDDSAPASPRETEARAEVPIPAASLGRARHDAWRPRKRLREQPKALYAIVVLVALLAAQVLLEFRDALAAHVPTARPVLETACALAGCAIGPLRDSSALSIEASDLQTDPAHKGLLKLTATVRNRAAYPIAYPYLELTLTDASDTVVARRAFPPSSYTASVPDVGIAGNGEVLVSMFFDASGTAQAGYRLYLFYP